LTCSAAFGFTPDLGDRTAGSPELRRSRSIRIWRSSPMISSACARVIESSARALGDTALIVANMTIAVGAIESFCRMDVLLAANQTGLNTGIHLHFAGRKNPNQNLS
jgi:hypothetical protein